MENRKKLKSQQLAITGQYYQQRRRCSGCFSCEPGLTIFWKEPLEASYQAFACQIPFVSRNSLYNETPFPLFFLVCIILFFLYFVFKHYVLLFTCTISCHCARLMSNNKDLVIYLLKSGLPKHLRAPRVQLWTCHFFESPLLQVKNVICLTVSFLKTTFKYSGIQQTVKHAVT